MGEEEEEKTKQHWQCPHANTGVSGQNIIPDNR